MVRLIVAGLSLLGLAACATAPDAHWLSNLFDRDQGPGQYSFDWQMAGDAELAPLQVFDDGRQTWLQYHEGGAVPAIFERTPDGDRLLRPVRKGQYLLIRGVPGQLVLRGGLLQARVWRAGSGHGPDPLAVSGNNAISGPDQAVAEPVAALPPAPAPLPVPVPMPPPEPQQPLPSPQTPPKTESAAPVSPSPKSAPPVTAVKAAPALVLEPVFDASPADGNIRKALGRWAQASGWTFEAEHWNVDVDIPLAGSATFEGPFRQAVRDLLAATELGDRPLQPCFYSNRVLRVVPMAQRCDRTQQAGGAA